MSKRDNEWLYIALTIAVDILSVNLAYLLAFWLRFYAGIVPITKGIPSLGSYLYPMVMITFLFIIIFKVMGLYTIQKIKSEGWKITKAVSLLILIFMAVTFLYREISYSRVFLSLFWGTTILIVMLSRRVITKVKENLIEKGILKKRALIITSRNENLKKELEATKEFEIVQVVDFKDLNKLRKLVKDKFIDTIFLMLPDTEQHQILDIINVAGHHIDYKIIPTVTDLVKKQFIISYVGALPVLTLKETPLQGFNMLMKRIFDIVIATTILLLSLPLTMIIALAIKLSSSGPLLYHQERISYNNKPFTIHKFRTMIQEAEKETGPIWAKKDDGRVTKTGHWLRKTNLDELPQLINVLKGDMSIVGPRPERPFFTEKFSKEIKAYFERHTVKPGMTGWAQVNGYIGNTSLEERIKHDVYYIQNWSLLFDLKILFLTLPFIFSQNLQFDKWRHRL